MSSLNDRASTLLGRLFQHPLDVQHLLQDAGVPADEIPPYGQLPPKTYWKNGVMALDAGLIPEEQLAARAARTGLASLLLAARERFPGNGEIKKLLEEIGNGPVGPACLLFLSATPLDADPLRAGRDFNAIHTCFDGVGVPRVEIVPHLSATPDEVLRLLLKHKPALVHFAGHGEENGALVFENAQGNTVRLGAAALGQVFAAVNQPTPVVRCVVLNACFSAKTAQVLVQHVEAAVGTRAGLTDDLAPAFAQGFYLGLADRRSVGSAAELGKAQMALVEASIGRWRGLGAPDPDRGDAGSDDVVALARAGIDLNALYIL